MKTNCKHVSNKGNGHNCKKSPKNPKSLLFEGCTFYRNNGLNGNGKEIIQAEMLCKNLNDCHAKKNDLEYWKTVLVPEVQERICLLNESANVSTSAKEKNKVSLLK